MPNHFIFGDRGISVILFHNTEASPMLFSLNIQVTQNIGVIEVEHAKRRAGVSGYTLRKLLHLWSSMFINFSVAPLRLSIGLGLLLAGLGFMGVIWVFMSVSPPFGGGRRLRVGLARWLTFGFRALVS